MTTLTLPSIICEVDKIFIDVLSLSHVEKVDGVLDDWLDQAEDEEHCQAPPVHEVEETHSDVATNPLQGKCIQFANLFSSGWLMCVTPSSAQSVTSKIQVTLSSKVLPCWWTVLVLSGGTPSDTSSTWPGSHSSSCSLFDHQAETTVSPPRIGSL